MKKILVLDVPMIYDSRRRLLCNLCNKCPIWNHERCYCQYDFNMKAKGCPLKPMPQKKISECLVCLNLVQSDIAEESRTGETE